MIQKSLSYVVIAIAVGYLLISAIPQQVEMYSIPQQRVPSLIEYTRLCELMKWWTLDVLFAIMIYWVARRRLV
jgi:hypothetical protein